MSAFDAIASEFERNRTLPAHVPLAIRQALKEHGCEDPALPTLEIGCGSGRIGSHFSDAGDRYVGLDLSLGMLREFDRKVSRRKPNLVCGDGSLLPFGDGAFASVLMLHLTAAERARAMLMEAVRVLAKAGVLAVGGTVAPPDGVDARMRARLNELLDATGMGRRAGTGIAAETWLGERCSVRTDVVASEWTAERSPQEFILRKKSAAPFAALPAGVRDCVLSSLAAWAEERIGPLTAHHAGTYRFILKLYRFGGAAGHG